MSKILSNLKKYVDDLKLLSSEERKSKNLDISFGRVLYSTLDTFSFCNNIDIRPINIRIVMNAHGSSETIIVIDMVTNAIAIDYPPPRNQMTAIVNDIFTILEDVSGEAISSLSNGMFDYYDIPETGLK